MCCRYDEHKNYETYLGIPEWLARVEDVLFEGLPKERSKRWPLEFSEAIRTGTDLNKIKNKFVVFILEENVKVQENQLRNNMESSLDIIIKETIKVNKNIIDMYLLDEKVESAAAVARSAAAAAAARSAAAAAAAWSAESAAAAAVWSAAGAATATAAAAARSAAAAAAAWSAESAAAAAAWSAESAAYERYADKLLELIKNAE